MPTFSEAQKREFIRNGFIVIQDALDETDIAEARGIIDTHLPDDLTDKSGLWESIEETAYSEERQTIWLTSPPHDVFESLNKQVFAYAEQLVGEGLLEPSTGNRLRTVTRWPQGRLTDLSTPQPTERGSHIDGESFPHVIGGGIYLDRIQPRGGGFTVWPGSHWHAMAHKAADRPDDGDDHGNTPSLDADGSWNSERRLWEQFSPFEVAGDPGTLILWHGFLEHSGGINMSPGTRRLAGFTRFGWQEDPYENEPVTADPFEYWDGLEDVDLDVDLTSSAAPEIDHA